jgi:hypothetical protein
MNSSIQGEEDSELVGVKKVYALEGSLFLVQVLLYLDIELALVAVVL